MSIIIKTKGSENCSVAWLDCPYCKKPVFIRLQAEKFIIEKKKKEKMLTRCPKCKSIMSEYNGDYECEVCGYRQKRKVEN
jgi:ribosomal protein S27AE